MSDLVSESMRSGESPAESPVADDFDRPRPRPRSRRRIALIVVAVVCVVTAGVAVGLVIGLRDDASGVGIADTPEELETIALPAGCELLTPGQAGGLVPGDPTRAGRGPEVILGASESACSWANTEIDPSDPRVQPASLEVKATAAVDEDAAKDLMKISLPCLRQQGTEAVVFGADEACLSHKAPAKGGPADIATVSARYQSLVVEVSYQRANWPEWRVEDQCEVTAAALIGEIVQAQ
jgi:hypothetical protein